MKVFAVILESYAPRADKSFKIILGTREATPEDAGYLQQHLHKEMIVAIKEDPFKKPELEDLDKLAVEYTDTEKSPSKRLKSVLYRLWEVDNEGFMDSTDFYIHKMTKLIEHFKSKLP